MLYTIISVIIANAMFFAIWILVAGFTKFKVVEAPKPEKKTTFQTCGDPECECSQMDCD